jgi:glycosyltransferase involved in cell wall biosynthesis
MRIVIDLQGAQSESRFRGIGRYSLSLSLAIAKHAQDHDVWLALNGRLPESIPSIRAAFSKWIPEERVRIFDVPDDRAPTAFTGRASEIVRERFLATLQPDVVLVSSVFEGPWAGAVTSIGAIKSQHKTAAIFYDLIPLLDPDVYLPTPELKDYYYRKINWLKNADLLLAISESSGSEATEHLSIPQEKLVNISAAIGDQFHPTKLDESAAALMFGRLGIVREYVLFAPGGFDPRKNFARLIEAYSNLAPELRKRYQLVIASKLHPPQRAELLDYAQRFGLRDEEMVLTGYVEDHELVALYSMTTLFVFPSTHEGFGLPVLEAMACGAAVIGSNCSSVPEVIGLEAALFDPHSPASITQKIQQGLQDNDFRDQLLANASSQSKRFSWDESAKKAIAAIEALPVTAKAQNPTFSRQSLIEELTAVEAGPESDEALIQLARAIAYNFHDNTDKQLFLDVSSIVHSDAKSGIQRVVRSLLHEFLTSPPPGILVRPIYYNDDHYYYAEKFTSIVTSDATLVADSLIDFKQGDIYLSLDLNMHLTNQLQPLHMHMKNMGVQINYLVYDLLLIHRPDWWHAPNPEFFSIWLKKVCEVGNNLICISQAVADELQIWLGNNPPDRLDGGPVIKSFHLGADIDSSLPSGGLPDDAPQTLEIISQRPSFLMVSTIEPRKGHAQALAAFELLWGQNLDINLVIVGKRGWLVDELVATLETHPRRHKQLFWLEGISDEYLERVYSTCDCLIAASEGEGFGLPLIEAAQHKLPMIIRDIPVFREVAGNHASYFAGLAPTALANSIQSWLTQRETGENPTSELMPWLTWKQSADQLKGALV